jgi:hypothetical protein
MWSSKDIIYLYRLVKHDCDLVKMEFACIGWSNMWSNKDIIYLYGLVKMWSSKDIIYLYKLVKHVIY